MTFKDADPARYDFETGSVVVPVVVNGENFECSVTQEASEDHFGLEAGGDALKACLANDAAIDGAIVKAV